MDDAPASKLEAALTILAHAGIDVPSAYTPALVEATPAEADDEGPEPTDEPDASRAPSELTPAAGLDRVQAAADSSPLDEGVADLDAALERSDGAAREDAAVDRLLTSEADDGRRAQR